MSLRVASSAENWTSSVKPRARVTAATARSRHCSRVIRSLRSRCRSEVAMKVWMRLRSAGIERLAGGVDVARRAARQRRDHRPSNLGRDPPHRLGVGLRGDREPGLDDVDAQLVELAGQPQLLVDAHREAGRLLPVPQGGVEDDDRWCPPWWVSSSESPGAPAAADPFSCMSAPAGPVRQRQVFQ